MGVSFACCVVSMIKGSAQASSSAAQEPERTRAVPAHALANEVPKPKKGGDKKGDTWSGARSLRLYISCNLYRNLQIVGDARNFAIATTHRAGGDMWPSTVMSLNCWLAPPLRWALVAAVSQQDEQRYIFDLVSTSPEAHWPRQAVNTKACTMMCTVAGPRTSAAPPRACSCVGAPPT